MALRVLRDEPSAVPLPFGDAYLARLAGERLRLVHLVHATETEIAKRDALLLAGLTARHVTRLDVAGHHIRRSGRTGITVE
jgi:hypothetical protein